MQDQNVDRISLWSQAGPSLLLGAFSVVLFKCAPHYWPLTLTAYLGYGAIRLFAKKGFILSLIALAVVAGLFFRAEEIVWPLLLTFSIALSWMLIFLGGKEKEVFYLGCAETIQDLEKECSTLQEEVRKAKSSLSLENKEMIAEKERLNALYSQTALKLEQAEKECEKLSEKCESLSKDLSSSQRKEAAFQHALNDAQEQLLKLKNESASKVDVSTIVPQEEGNAEEKARIEQVQHQYANLREQFDEKSQALDLARKELFRVENDLLTLQKVTEESACEVSDEELVLMNNLLAMEEECEALEAQVSSLQEFISSLLTPKKRAVRSKKGAKSEEELDEIIQDKIDQTTST